MDRREFLQTSGLALGSLLLQDEKKKPTQFQVACMTLPYAQFPLDRALTGIKSAGYKNVAWYTSHKEGGKSVAVIAPDDPPEKARDLGQRCRDMGLEPLLMFSGIYPEAKSGLEVLKEREQVVGCEVGEVERDHIAPMTHREKPQEDGECVAIAANRVGTDAPDPG